MAKDTKGQLLDAAAKQFAEKGFYGATIASIADELGLTKQALLHHFGAKEKLYGEVLARISRRMEEMAAATRTIAAEPEAQLEHFMLSLFEQARRDGGETRLLMRELLDNNQRAEQAGAWYMRDFLDALTAMALGGRPDDPPERAEAQAEVYALLGAVNYFVISEPTLRNMFGAEAFKALADRFPETLRLMLRARRG